MRLDLRKALKRQQKEGYTEAWLEGLCRRRISGIAERLIQGRLLLPSLLDIIGQ